MAASTIRAFFQGWKSVLDLSGVSVIPISVDDEPRKFRDAITAEQLSTRTRWRVERHLRHAMVEFGETSEARRRLSGASCPTGKGDTRQAVISRERDGQAPKRERRE